MGTETIRELDTVALRHRHGRWPAGTTGAVVQTFHDQAALVELVGPDGCTLDLLTLPQNELTVLPRPDTTPGTERRAG